MKKIRVIIFSRLGSEAQYEFLSIYRKLLEKYPDVQAIVIAQYGNFIILLNKEGEMLKAMRKSDFTKLIAEADSRTDRCIVGMREQIVAATHHFDPVVADAANSLLNRFATFGVISKKSYEEQPAALNLLIESLNSPEYAGKIVTVGLSDWLTELQSATLSFENLFEQRNVERAKLPVGNLKDIKKDIEGLYHTMIDRFSASAILGDNASLDAFIAELNTQIDYFNDHNSARAKKNIATVDACFVEPVVSQTYTGKPIIVIPVVFFREEGNQKQEMVFAKDFSVTYKNNIEVGTANIVIHGKGSYKGQKLITFNIV